MRALAIIAAEHANMLRLSGALDVLGDRLAEAASAEDLHTVALIADYFQSFADRVHHPKESEVLFARVRRRSNEAAEVLERLDREHEIGPSQSARIHALAVGTPPSDRAGVVALIAEIEGFRSRLLEHMRVEEEIAFPLARRALTAD